MNFIEAYGYFTLLIWILFIISIIVEKVKGYIKAKKKVKEDAQVSCVGHCEDIHRILKEMRIIIKDDNKELADAIDNFNEGYNK